MLDALVKSAPQVLHMQCDGGSPGAVWAKAIADRVLPSVRVLVFDSPSLMPARQAEHSLGDIAATLRAMPALTRAQRHEGRGGHAKLEVAWRELTPISAGSTRPEERSCRASLSRTGASR